jgi:hypothetical protein
MALKTPNPSGGQLASTQSPAQFWITLEAGEPAEARIVATALAPARDQRLLICLLYGLPAMHKPARTLEKHKAAI